MGKELECINYIKGRNSIMVAKIVLFLIVLFLFIFISWRFLSTRYSLPCPSWLGWMVEMDNPFTKVNRAATIIEYLNVTPGMTVLDVGCGPGRITIPLAKKIGPEGKVVAMDIQEEMLKKVKQKAALQEIYNALKPDGILSVTELIFDPHFQRKVSVLKIAEQVGFQEKAFFGSWYAYTMHLKKK